MPKPYPRCPIAFAAALTLTVPLLVNVSGIGSTDCQAPTALAIAAAEVPLAVACAPTFRVPLFGDRSRTGGAHAADLAEAGSDRRSEGRAGAHRHDRLDVGHLSRWSSAGGSSR